MNWLHRNADTFYAVLRIIAGFLFACHGAQKLFGLFGGHVETGDAMGLVAGIIEFFGGVLIALGFQAGPVAFLASGEMAVAYFKAHAPRNFLPLQNHGELAAIYCFLFLYIAAKGSGIFSVDRLLPGHRPA